MILEYLQHIEMLDKDELSKLNESEILSGLSEKKDIPLIGIKLTNCSLIRATILNKNEKEIENIKRYGIKNKCLNKSYQRASSPFVNTFYCTLLRPDNTARYTTALEVSKLYKEKRLFPETEYIYFSKWASKTELVFLYIFDPMTYHNYEFGNEVDKICEEYRLNGNYSYLIDLYTILNKIFTRKSGNAIYDYYLSGLIASVFFSYDKIDGIIYHSVLNNVSGLNLSIKESSFNESVIPIAIVKSKHYRWIDYSLLSNECYADTFTSDGDFKFIKNYIQFKVRILLYFKIAFNGIKRLSRSFSNYRFLLICTRLGFR